LIFFEISLTFISSKPSPKPSDVQLLSTWHVTKVHLLQKFLDPQKHISVGFLRKGNRMVNTFPFVHIFFHVNENLERFPHVGNILSIKDWLSRRTYQFAGIWQFYKYGCLMRISEIFLLENLSINVPYHRLTTTA
jgi:hypothetical protein